MYNLESTLFNQLLKLIWECGIRYSSLTLENGLKWACCYTITFVQGSGKARTVWKQTF